MAFKHHSFWTWAGRLAISALALAACAAPATLAPTLTPTPPATATALPPTAAAATNPTSTAVLNAPVRATSVSLNIPQDIAFDAEGNWYISEWVGGGNSRIDKVDAFGLLTRYAGTGGVGFSADGVAAPSADLACVSGLAFDPGGNLNFTDGCNHRVRRIDKHGIITTVAGSGPTCCDGGSPGFSGDGGPATSARLWGPTDITFDRDGNLYISDTGNNRIRKVDRQGIITTVAGNGTRGFAGDGGPATAANLDLFGYSASMGVDAAGNVYVAENQNGRVRKIDPQGIITTIAGNGGPTVSGDGGLATAAALPGLTGLAVDAEGNLFVCSWATSESFDARVRKIDRRGIITTVVGTGALNFSGDGRPALSATLSGCQGIALDAHGNLFIADKVRVRKVDIKGIITTVAGGAP